MSEHIPDTRLVHLDPSTIHRQVTVRPAMCGAHSQFVAQVGDWTWDAVSEVCRTNVLVARNLRGDPTYLAFYYYHVRGGPDGQVSGLSFGDRLDVVSKVFRCGSESVLTLHRIAINSAEGAMDFELGDFFDRTESACIYVESFNRWVCRRAEGQNSGLVRSSPQGFEHEHLPSIPARYSPRRAYGAAKLAGRFRDGHEPAARKVAELELPYELDASRDVNAVGLMYFASYHAIVDRAIWTLWRELGRREAAFLKRTVLDHKLCYLSNVELGASLRLKVSLWTPEAESCAEIFDVELVDARSRGTVAIATVVVALPEKP